MERLKKVAAAYNLDLNGLFRKCGIYHNPLGLEDRAVDMRIKTLQRIMDTFPDINVNYIVSGSGPIKFDDYEHRAKLLKHLQTVQKDAKTWKDRYYQLYDDLEKKNNSPKEPVDVVWNNYPDILPERGKHYLVITEDIGGKFHMHFDFYSMVDDVWGSMINREEVRYWATPPGFPKKES